jgi:transposase
MPKLETGALTQRATRRLKTKAARQMLSLGHAAIFDRLREKCQEYGTTFVQVKEHYTSQTCLLCGTLNKCGETYRCKKCSFCCDRDVAGAAGIYLKAVRTEAPEAIKRGRAPRARRTGEPSCG